MKLLKWLGGILAFVLVLVYVMAFTPLGNGIVAPIIEKEVNKAADLDAKLETFVLDMNSLEVVLALDSQNKIEVKGSYSLFAQSFDINYDVALKNLSALEKLAQMKLNGAFLTEGIVKGDLSLIKVDGKSDVAKSTTTYHVILEDFNPTSIIAQIDKLDLKTLLYMVNQPQYASAKVDLNVNFKDIKPHQLDGTVTLVTTQGELNSAVMKKDFNVTIPKTSFGMSLDAKLAGDDVNYNYLLDSNLAKIASKGLVVPEPLKVDTTYSVNVQELGVLKPITGADLRGMFNLSGSAKGTQEKLIVDGKSDLAGSNTTFTAILKEFQPASVIASIKHLKLQKLLYMVKQPHYADADFELEAKLSSLDPKNLQGTVKTAISNGVVDHRYMTKAYEFKSPMPKTTFNGTTNSLLSGTLIDTKMDINSNLANFDIKSAKFDLKDSSLLSDYIVKIPNLDKLYFATQQHMKGGLTANGELKKGEDLDFTMLSKIAGGKLNANLHNDDFTAKLNSIDTLTLLDMLLYPQIFKSAIDGDLKYNLLTSTGKFVGKIKDGKFTKNQVLDVTKQYAHVDMYRETFLGDMNADIVKEKITASFDLKSNKSSISTKDTKLNSETQKIDSKIKIVADNNAPIYVKLKGDISSPKVSVDAKEIVNTEATKAIKKEAKKFIEKNDLDKKATKLLKNLF